MGVVLANGLLGVREIVGLVVWLETGEDILLEGTAWFEALVASLLEPILDLKEEKRLIPSCRRCLERMD